MPDEQLQTLETQIAILAETLGMVIGAEHLKEAARSWQLLAPHRARVMASELSSESEPAPVFRP